VPDFSIKAHPVREIVERARSKQRPQIPRQSPGSSPARLPIVLKPCTISTHTGSSSNDSTPKATTPNPQPSSKVKLDIKTKTEIQALVVSALQPHYQTQKINKDEYTDINRDVSRRLYEQIGTEDGLTERERWQKVAIEEVQRAVKALRKEAGGELGITTAVVS
jgi:histone H3/H4